MKGTIFLIHWNISEAEELAETLRSWGWRVTGVEAEDGARGSKTVKENPPDVLVIFLTRLPSHGRQTAAYLRQLKATQELPIVFVGGKDAAVTKTREKVPDALYVSSEELEAALEQFAADS